MEQYVCDICGSVCDSVRYKFDLEMLRDSSTITETEINEYINDPCRYLLSRFKNCKKFEICDNCFKLINKVLNLRIIHIKKLHKKSNIILKDLDL